MSSINATAPVSRISTGRVALLVTLGTESVFFLTMLVAYAALRNEVGWSVAHTPARLAIPLVNTTILVVSAVFAWWSNKAIRDGGVSALQAGLAIALLLGLVFVAGQVYEFSHAGLQIDDQAYGGVFFALMGFHALHVLGGIVFLALNLVRARLGDFSARQHEAVDLGAAFWYYVTAVWLVLFAALYLL
jgi:heme/copper-type cytochrome/quinol oxidase subunit 3